MVVVAYPWWRSIRVAALMNDVLAGLVPMLTRLRQGVAWPRTVPLACWIWTKSPVPIPPMRFLLFLWPGVGIFRRLAGDRRQ